MKSDRLSDKKRSLDVENANELYYERVHKNESMCTA